MRRCLVICEPASRIAHACWLLNSRLPVARPHCAAPARPQHARSAAWATRPHPRLARAIAPSAGPARSLVALSAGPALTRPRVTRPRLAPPTAVPVSSVLANGCLILFIHDIYIYITILNPVSCAPCWALLDPPLTPALDDVLSEQCLPLHSAVLLHLAANAMVLYVLRCRLSVSVIMVVLGMVCIAIALLPDSNSDYGVHTHASLIYADICAIFFLYR